MSSHAIKAQVPDSIRRLSSIRLTGTAAARPRASDGVGGDWSREAREQTPDIGLQEDGAAVWTIKDGAAAPAPAGGAKGDAFTSPLAQRALPFCEAVPSSGDGNGEEPAHATAGFVNERNNVDAAHDVGEA